MKKNYIIIIFILLPLFLAGSFSNAFAQQPIGSQYCQAPPVATSVAEPNVLFVLDASGSMSWNAYDYPASAVYDATKSYEGYFDPSKSYTLVSGIYKEHTPTGLPCTCTCSSWRCRNSNWGGCVWHGGGCGRWGCCLAQTCTGDCGIESGNELNFDHMRRVDLLRWAITGGKPSSCDGSHTFDTGYCDPELYNDVTGSGKVNTVCSDTLAINDTGTVQGGCILLADDGTQVTVPWDRVNASVANTLKALSLRPRIGAMSYQNSSVLAQKVYIGDFLAPNSTNTSFPYMNLITHINSISPNGSTPTGPAMWDALNYYAQNAPQYGGFSVQSGSGDHWKNPMYVCDGGGSNCTSIPCANNFVILMSDGQWNTPSCSIGSSPSCTSGSSDPAVPAYCMHKGFTNAGTNENTKVTSVYNIGLFLGGTGELALKNIAMYGSFDNVSKTWPDSLTGYPNSTCTMDDCGSGRGSACTALPTSSVDWDSDADNVPDTFYNSTDAHEIRDRIVSVMESILSHSLSGSAASVLASGQGSGSSMLQAVYYPRRTFGDASISWAGYLQNLWLFRSKFFEDKYGNLLTSIREDTSIDKILDISNDYIASYFYDTATQETKVARCKDVNKDGGCTTTPPSDVMQPTVLAEDISSLWEAGKLLWRRPDPRKIYTQLDGSNLIDFSTANVTTLMPYLDLPAIGDLNLDGWIDGDINHSGAVDSTDATYLIKYIHGEDIDLNGDNIPDPWYRSRTVQIDTETHVWKLGDIINSTPKILSWVPLNGYHIAYKDSTYAPTCEDCEVSLSEPPNPNYFTTRGTQLNVVDGVSYGTIGGYRGKNMVFVGANDGMLHAFKLGTLKLNWTGKTTDQFAKLEGTDLGKEMWAFIPKNVLPYLRYMMDPKYCHVYSVDLTPYLIDASINNDHSAVSPAGCSDTDYWKCTKTADSWRTILIGGMRLGGACKGSDNSTCTDCVKAPGADTNSDGDKTDTGENLVGLSSYFALDVTDQDNPRLLWEFTHEELGFASTGVSIVKIGARKADGSVDVSKNGRFFVVFGSGPTGPITTGGMQFLGRSDQNLKLFILDLKTGILATPQPIDTGIENAFASSMFNSGHDFIQSKDDYQDDAVYLGYTKKCAATNNICTKDEWNDGGVLRLVTKKTLLNDTPLYPANWAVSKVIDGIGPVTGGVQHLKKNSANIVWLYFSTGRWFYTQGTSIDDPDKTRSLFGLKEPCFSISGLDVNCTTDVDFCTTPCSNSPSCTSPGTCVDLRNLTNPANVAADPDASSYKGWYINLDVAGNYTYSTVTRSFKAERSASQPNVSTLGCAYFTSFKPYDGGCNSGGKSFSWSLDAEYGSPKTCPAITIIQLSTGAIIVEQLPPGKGPAMEGITPPTSVDVVPPKPVKRALHMKER